MRQIFGMILSAGTGSIEFPQKRRLLSSFAQEYCFVPSCFLVEGRDASFPPLGELELRRVGRSVGPCFDRMCWRVILWLHGMERNILVWHVDHVLWAFGHSGRLATVTALRSPSPGRLVAIIASRQ